MSGSKDSCNHVGKEKPQDDLRRVFEEKRSYLVKNMRVADLLNNCPFGIVSQMQESVILSSERQESTTLAADKFVQYMLRSHDEQEWDALKQALMSPGQDLLRYILSETDQNQIDLLERQKNLVTDEYKPQLLKSLDPCEFCNRFNFTDSDRETILKAFDNKGHSDANGLVLRRMVKYLGWFDKLLKILDDLGIRRLAKDLRESNAELADCPARNTRSSNRQPLFLVDDPDKSALNVRLFVKKNVEPANDQPDSYSAGVFGFKAPSSETGSRQTNLSAVGRETGSRQTNLSAVGRETGSRQTHLSAVGRETGSRQTNLSAVGRENGSRQTNLSALGRERGLRQTNLSAVDRETGSRQTSLSVDVSERTESNFTQGSASSYSSPASTDSKVSSPRYSKQASVNNSENYLTSTGVSNGDSQSAGSREYGSAIGFHVIYEQRKRQQHRPKTFSPETICSVTNSSEDNTCSNQFSQNSNLSKSPHPNKPEAQTGREHTKDRCKQRTRSIFRCDHCYKAYVRKDDQVKHMHSCSKLPPPVSDSKTSESKVSSSPSQGHSQKSSTNRPVSCGTTQRHTSRGTVTPSDHRDQQASPTTSSVGERRRNGIHSPSHSPNQSKPIETTGRRDSAGRPSRSVFRCPHCDTPFLQKDDLAKHSCRKV